MRPPAVINMGALSVFDMGNNSIEGAISMRVVFRTRLHESGEPKTDLVPFWFDPDTEKPNPPKGFGFGWILVRDLRHTHHS